MDENQDLGAVQRSQEFFRLKQLITGQGDIFELNESSKAMYIGPDSDIGEVQVVYYNPDEPGNLETAVVSVNGPLVGRIDSLPITKVGSTGQGARILVSPVDIVNPSYDPGPLGTPGLEKLALRTYRAPVYIDFMVALKPLPSIPEVRADRTLRYSQVPFEISTSDPESDGSTNLIIPIYGRRMASLQVINYSAVVEAQVSLALICLSPGNANTRPRWVSGGFQGSQIASTILVPRTDTNTGEPFARAAVIRASDAMRAGVTMNGAAAVTGAYLESDAPPEQSPVGGQGLGVYQGGPRGMADLLLINIKEKQFGSVPPEQTNYVDVFIKLCDRET